MENFKNLVVQTTLCGAIYLLGYIAFGLVFGGWVLMWQFFEMFFRE
ncbi:MAG: hypothetical protein H7Y59_03155 [Anaerolineales bacterium]|nr:hypothetical protein [Anaerolineales bacterium]